MLFRSVLYRDPESGGIGTSPWTELQLLTLPGTTPSTTPGSGEFGYSVAMSLDERWMYIGAPGINNVYAYGRVDWQDQILAYAADGVSTTVEIGDVIQIDNENQLSITVNGKLLDVNVDYTVSPTFSSVTFISVPTEGQIVKIRRQYITAYGGGSATYNVTDSLFDCPSIDSFSVAVDNILQRPNIDYTYDGTDITFEAGSIPSGGSTVNISRRWYYTLVDTLTVAGLGGSDRFGASVSCTTDGRQVFIGAPYSTEDTLQQAGSVYVFDRNVQKFIYGTDPSSVSFTVLGTVTEPVSVLVNNQFLTNQASAVIGGQNTFTVSGNTVTLNTDLTIGSIIEIEINQFELQQKITQNTEEEFSNFGQAQEICNYNCSLYVDRKSTRLNSSH